MPLTAMGLGYTFTANNLASGPIRKLKSDLNGLSDSAQSAKKHYEGLAKRGALEFAAGAAGLMVINGLTKAYGEFEYKLTSAGAIMGATETDLRRLERAAIDAGIATQFSPTEAVGGLENLGAAGMSATNAIKTLNPVLDLAAASLGQIGVAEAASNVVGVLNAFGDSADFAGKRVDQLVKITQMSNFQARDFSIALSQASAQAKAADQSFESMTATLGMLRNTNLDASSAATAYREAVRRVSGDKLALRKLRQLDIEVLDKETGKIKDLGRIMTEVIPKVAKLDAKKRNLALTRIFGVRGMKTYNAFVSSYHKLLKEGKVAIGDYSGAHRMLVQGLESSQGAAAKTRDQLLKTSKGQRILLQGSIETFKVVAGKALIPALLPVLKNLTAALNVLIKIFDAIPGPVRSFISYFAGAGATLLAFSGIVKMLVAARGLMALRRATSTAGDAAELLAKKQALANTQLVKGMPIKQQAAVMTAKIGQSALRALPFIGMGVSAMMGLFAMMRAREDKEKKRVLAVRAQQRQMREQYRRTAETVNRIGQAAERSGEKLIKMSRTKDLLKAQQIIRMNVAKAEAKEAQMHHNLERIQFGRLSKTQKKEIEARNVKLRQEMYAARKIAEVYGKVDLQIRAKMLRRRHISRRTVEDNRVIVAANQIIIEKMKKREGKLEKQLALARDQGHKKSIKTLTRDLNRSQKRREKLVVQTKKLAGDVGVKKFAAPAVRKIQALAGPVAATGLDQATIDQIARGTADLGYYLRELSPSQGAALLKILKKRAITRPMEEAEAAKTRARRPWEQRTREGRGAGSVIEELGRDIGRGGRDVGLKEDALTQAGYADLPSIIAQAIKQGMENASITLNVDGQDLQTSNDSANISILSRQGQPTNPPR